MRLVDLKDFVNHKISPPPPRFKKIKIKIKINKWGNTARHTSLETSYISKKSNMNLMVVDCAKSRSIRTERNYSSSAPRYNYAGLDLKY